MRRAGCKSVCERSSRSSAFARRLGVLALLASLGGCGLSSCEYDLWLTEGELGVLSFKYLGERCNLGCPTSREIAPGIRVQVSASGGGSLFDDAGDFEVRSSDPEVLVIESWDVDEANRSRVLLIEVETLARGGERLRGRATLSVHRSDGELIDETEIVVHGDWDPNETADAGD